VLAGKLWQYYYKFYSFCLFCYWKFWRLQLNVVLLVATHRDITTRCKNCRGNNTGTKMLCSQCWQAAKLGPENNRLSTWVLNRTNISFDNWKCSCCVWFVPITYPIELDSIDIDILNEHFNSFRRPAGGSKSLPSHLGEANFEKLSRSNNLHIRNRWPKLVGGNARTDLVYFFRTPIKEFCYLTMFFFIIPQKVPT